MGPRRSLSSGRAFARTRWRGRRGECSVLPTPNKNPPGGHPGGLRTIRGRRAAGGAAATPFVLVVIVVARADAADVLAEHVILRLPPAAAHGIGGVTGLLARGDRAADDEAGDEASTNRSAWSATAT